jgi:aminobenzoyl-glutamate utilization protein B
MVDFRFYGRASHAAGSPDKGRSALDGVEALNYMVNLMREHVPTSSRIHYVIPDGGGAPNVVPDYARVSYYIRSPKREILKELKDRIYAAAEGAAFGNGNSRGTEIVSGFYERLHNRKLAELVQRNLKLVGGVDYDAREQKFAEEIARGLNENRFCSSTSTSCRSVERGTPIRRRRLFGCGRCKLGCPYRSFYTASFIPGSAGHSWQNVALVALPLVRNR